jgi:acyl-coenzyme A thioesterase PaaI-like protein
MNAMKPNRLLKIVNQINRRVPSFLRGRVLSMAFNSQIKYAGTTGIAIQRWSKEEAVVSLQNRRRVQNHLQGVHATAMATLAESATGMVFGIHVPDSHLPVLKSMNIQFTKRAKGDLQAVASISEDQIHAIQTQDRGSAIIAVKVTDEDGKEPIACQMEWAWTTKRKKEQSTVTKD